MKLDHLKSPEVAALPRDTVVVLPIASIEQHGPHLPVGTDSMIGQGIVDALDEAMGGRLLVMPMQKYTCSEHHMAFAGTVTLTHETFKVLVLEAIHSMYRHGFRRFLLLNSHGGNIRVGGVIAEQASIRWPDAELLFATWFQVAAKALAPLCEGEYPSVGHACEFETSMMLVLHPDLVDMKKAIDDGLINPVPSMRGDLLSGTVATLSQPFHKFTKRGVFGKATLASEEKGRKLLEVTVNELKTLLEQVWPDAATTKRQKSRR